MEIHDNQDAIIKCYICDSENVTLVRKHLRYNIKRDVYQCVNCMLVFLDPKDLGDYYETEEYRKKILQF